ncbi:BTB/POZ domain-containing protein 7 [Armadillidium nasatum]|uniref:BTB/POZ domain-containing protein 7 n=1 Tax=Armadillidium nasatum TaxID=96803 RepID=A0A5N5T4F1_9CRUS|nr:BTB/POZ domain-containing protein 7 [Armadillidium nasatum]
MVWCYWCRQGSATMGVNASCQADAAMTPNVLFNVEKKRRLAGLATLRKKLIRRRRSSKSCDHSRVIRELVSNWSADLARPPAPTYKQDLSDLFDYKYCTDVDLVFQGAIFPVHRAILSVRCPYFQEVLKKIPGYGAQIGVDIQTPGIDIPMFSALLRFLYTGEFNPYDGTSKAQQMRLNNLDLLMQLCDEFGTPNALECDLRYLLDSGDYADCILVFSSSGDCSGNQGGEIGGGSVSGESSCPSDYGFHNRLEVFCHKSILSARSPFFRSLIQRRQRYSEEMYERGIPQPTRIVLDEGVIPKRYARVLLQAIYLDTLNLSSIIRDSASTNSLSEAQSMVQTGRAHLTVVEEAMEIYQIGRFLELDILTQSCEDLIVESLSTDNLVSVLKWSDFLQAAELEVLQAVLRWGEHQLLKRMEDREPNLVSQTAHSVTRKGLRKRDLNDVELRDILSELLPLVRMDHVLPPNHDILTQAIKRRLVSTPPSHMIGDDNTNYRVNAWIRGKNNGLFVKPRLFTPYAEEIKCVVDEHGAGGGVDLVRLQCYVSHIPDTLYMVDNTPRKHSFCATAPVDVVAAAVPVPDADTVTGMVRRERELVSTTVYQRAAALLFADRRQLRRQVRLRVVREFNLPDAVADVLEGASYTVEEEEEDRDSRHQQQQQQQQRLCHVRDEGRSKLQPPEFLMESMGGAIPPHRHFSHFRTQEENKVGVDGHLSDIVPDVALASSSLSALHLGSASRASSTSLSHSLSRKNSSSRPPSYSSASLECLEGVGKKPPQLGLDLGDGSHQLAHPSQPLTTHLHSPTHTNLQIRVLNSGVLSLHRRQYSSRPSHQRVTVTPPQTAPPSPPVTAPPLGGHMMYEDGGGSGRPQTVPHTPPLRHYATMGSRHYNVSSVSSATTTPQMFL